MIENEKEETEAGQMGIPESGRIENYISGLDYFHAEMGEKEWRKWEKWLKKQERKERRGVFQIILERLKRRRTSLFQLRIILSTVFSHMVRSFNRKKS